MDYTLNNNYVQIITGTSNFTSPVYTEAVNDAENGTNKGMKQFAKFMESIENLAKKGQVQDSRLSSSKGNIKNFEGYENIKTAISFLNKNLKGIDEVADDVKVFDALENYSSLYEKGYEKNIRLIVLEYENALFMLTTSLSSVIACNMDVVANGTEIRIQKKNVSTHGTIQKTMKDLAKELSNRDHKDYLEGLIAVAEAEPVNESVYTEASVGGAISVVKLLGDMITNGYKIVHGGINMVKKIKKTIFGIVPLLRSIMYIRYKKKADTIVALEEQIVFIERNIEQLKNIKTMEERQKRLIIRKQEAYIEAYKKKSEKLRAQLMETEKQAATAIEADNTDLKDISDDDLVLESAAFMEASFRLPAKSLKARRNARKGAAKSPEAIKSIRRDTALDAFGGIIKKKLPDDTKKNEITAKAQKAVDLFVKNTEKDSIRLKPGKGSDKDTANTKTKIGGIPYWPEDEPWPEDTYRGKKQPMICLAQLNFSELPKLQGYPTSGLLQFFITDEECFDGSCRVVYRTDLSKKALTEVPRSTLNDEYTDYPSIDAVYYPTATLEKQPMTIADMNFSTELCKALNAVFGTNYTKWAEIPKEIDNAFWDIYKKIDYEGCRIGGHPYFTQSDVRDGNNGLDALLLQLDSESGMMWGDCGVANFFCSNETLKSKRFNEVFFTWDCC